MADLLKLDNVINELESHSKELLEVNKLLSEVATLKDELAKSLVVLEEINNGFGSITENLQTSITQSLEQLASKVDELYADNKKFYKELDALLHTLLEKHKSDIQVEVRNESQQLKSEIKSLQAEFDEKTNSLQNRVEETFKQQNTKTNILIFLVFVILSLSGYLIATQLG